MSYIIGKKKDGPRGVSDLDLSERDTVENILILCPTCHTLIDKNKDEFSFELLHQWKRQHKLKVDELFSILQYKEKDKIVLQGEEAYE